MMDCTNADVRDMLPDFAGGRLGATDRERVERHLEGCAECAAELSLLRSVARAIGRAPAVNVARIVAALPSPDSRPVPGVVPLDSRRRAVTAARPAWDARSFQPPSARAYTSSVSPDGFSSHT